MAGSFECWPRKSWSVLWNTSSYNYLCPSSLCLKHELYHLKILRVSLSLRGSIILLGDAISSEKYAVGKFQFFFEQATGFLLPIFSETRKENDCCIFVGIGDAMKRSQLRFDTTDFGTENLRVVVGESVIMIVDGRTSVGEILRAGMNWDWSW